MSLSVAQKAALKATADALSAAGKGFLASDESAGPWLRAGHVEAAKIADTAECRAAYRSMLYTTPGLSEYISGVILHVETLFQKDKNGKQLVDMITENGMIPGIKLDKGYTKTGISGTATGPLGHPETWCMGIDDLPKRAAEAYAQGARFAKWRNVLQIDPETGLPSDLAIEICVQNLAQYASICQAAGLVPSTRPPRASYPPTASLLCAPAPPLGRPGETPALMRYHLKIRARPNRPHAPRMRPASAPPQDTRAHEPASHELRGCCMLCAVVEPEIVPNGSHSIGVCAGITERVLAKQFAALALHKIYLPGCLLKPNMVKNGLTGPKASKELVAKHTIETLLKTVPPELPGIFFLSGETSLDEDNEETATINLNEMHKLYKDLPWSVSFSFGKALQKTCIVTWMGKEENNAAAQTALTNRSKANFLAAKDGSYVAGSCASIGADGNIEMKGGAY
jgi:fructose-bisphosphate aldolase class 1